MFDHVVVGFRTLSNPWSPGPSALWWLHGRAFTTTENPWERLQYTLGPMTMGFARPCVDAISCRLVRKRPGMWIVTLYSLIHQESTVYIKLKYFDAAGKAAPKPNVHALHRKPHLRHPPAEGTSQSAAPCYRPEACHLHVQKKGVGVFFRSSAQFMLCLYPLPNTTKDPCLRGLCVSE